ncbi:hypothetical protein ACWIGG_15695 [Micromonospora aurantiaca (nom. illeg.)]
MGNGKAVMAAAAMTASLIAIPMGASPAKADPGTCGIRHDFGTSQDGIYQYIVRNQCSRVVNMKIRTQGHWLYCKPVPANGYAGWVSIYFDNNWIIGYC